MIAVHCVNIVLGGYLTSFGIVPRQLSGLLGILTGVWIHSDIGHLLGNLSAFIVLASLCALRSESYFVMASFFIVLVGGVLVWLFGRTASHIGASGWIFGLWALLMANAYFDRTLKNILIGVLVFIFYGSLIWGILPRQGISFEGHIAGIVAGIWFAWITNKYPSLSAKALRPKT